MKTKLTCIFVFILAVSVRAPALTFEPISKAVTVEQSGSYRYELPLNIYITTAQLGHLDRLLSDLNYAQKKYDKCQIKLSLSELIEVKDSTWLNEWESFWFANANQLTNWEKSFFKNVKSSQINILLVESLNWTSAGQGTWGAGYAQFLRNEIPSEAEKLFFDQNAIGNVVIGDYRAESTLAHEIGHAGLNLEHSYDSKNIMNSIKSYEPIEFKNSVAQISTDLTFTAEQCAEGIKNNPFLRPVLPDFASVSDEIGNGVVTVNGKDIDSDACVLRLLYENNEYRIEYDYMGVADVKGLDRFDFNGAITTDKNTIERPLNLKPESKLAQKICEGSAFAGKKIFELKNEKSSEVRIEGVCLGDKAQKQEVLSLSCNVK